MARFNDSILAQDRARLRKNRTHLKILAAIILCFQIVSYGCLPMPGEPLEASQFDYLPERDDIIPLVVQRLRQLTDQKRLNALECMANRSIDKVTFSGEENLEFRDLLIQVLAEFKVERQMCLPLSGEWHVNARQVAPLSGTWLEGSGNAGAQAIVYWAVFCYASAGVACPVIKKVHLEFSTHMVFPDGRIRVLYGSGDSGEWSMTAWRYKAIRDEAFAEAASEALLVLVDQYSAVYAEMSLEQCQEE